MPSAGARAAWGMAAGVLAVAGAWSASGLGAGRWWMVAAAVALAVGIAVALPSLAAWVPQPGAVPAVALAWVAAIYACVPETDQVLAVALLAAGLAAVEVASHERLGFGWWLVVVTVVLWCGLFGATGRSSAVVGVLFGAWPLVIGPLVALAVPAGLVPVPARWLVVAGASVAALAVARSGALEPTVGPAVTAVAAWGGATLLFGLAVAVVSARRARPRRR